MFIGDFNMNVLESSDNPIGPNKDLTNFNDQFCLTNVTHEAMRTTNYLRTLFEICLTYTLTEWQRVKFCWLELTITTSAVM